MVLLTQHISWDRIAAHSDVNNDEGGKVWKIKRFSTTGIPGVTGYQRRSCLTTKPNRIWPQASLKSIKMPKRMLRIFRKMRHYLPG
ncbi:unnamed protein product [Rodentolepis nana]|uniref:N-acetylmuramoyl-L-alanine amidase n=1 Tax=Rodentolepis nana TaxID=102285 RepID=A0A0R3TKH3_RODNA|nr:unnamed protein product [Rodentolepis nana]